MTDAPCPTCGQTITCEPGYEIEMQIVDKDDDEVVYERVLGWFREYDAAESYAERVGEAAVRVAEGRE